MLDFIRNNNKLMQVLLFLLIIPSFIFAGVQGYSYMSGSEDVVAVVGGQKIHRTQWDQAHQRRVEQIRREAPSLDIKLFDTESAKYQTLETLINEEVITQAAEQSGIVITDEQVRAALMANPSVAQLVDGNGKLDVKRYQELLAANGLTVEQMESNVRSELKVQQLAQPLGVSMILPSAVADLSVNAMFKRRQVGIVQFNAEDFTSKVNVQAADLKSYYKEKSQDFRAPEKVDLEYVVFDAANFGKQISIREEDARAYYEQNKQKFSNETRRASHILIAAAKDAPSAERAKAKEKARLLLAQIQKKPENFAKLAQENSQDPGSAKKGGDLDFFARGSMVKPFEDAVFSLQKGAIAPDVVESDFGFHVIQLTDIKGEKEPSFEAVKPQIETLLREQASAKKLSETFAQFSDDLFNQTDDLQTIAKKYSLEVKSVAGLAKGSNAVADPLINNKELLGLIFSPESIEKKQNTKAIEVAPKTYVAAHVLKHYPSTIPPYEAVTELVKAQWVKQQSAELAKEAGQERMTSLKTNPKDVNGLRIVEVSRSNAERLPQELVDAILKADLEKLPTVTGASLDNNRGFVVASVLKELPPVTLSEGERKQMLGSLSQVYASAQIRAYYEYLRNLIKIDIKVPKPTIQRS